MLPQVHHKTTSMLQYSATTAAREPCATLKRTITQSAIPPATAAASQLQHKGGHATIASTHLLPEAPRLLVQLLLLAQRQAAGNASLHVGGSNLRSKPGALSLY
jgi:hypothetical protein